MKKTLFLLAILTVTVSCNKINNFRLEGKIADIGENEMLYFEHRGLLKTTVLDSVKLKKDGNFKFKAPKPAYPDLYSIRLKNNQQIILVIDSTETLRVNASAKNFVHDNLISGSDASVEIQKLRTSVMKIQEKVNLLQNTNREERANLEQEIRDMIDEHKKKAGELIFTNPRSMASYYALYQKINNIFLFSLDDKADYPYYAAVATSFHTFMPDYERSKNIYNYVLEAKKKENRLKERTLWNEIAAELSVGYIDIALPDRNEVEKKLSDLEGKLVLIDFSSYEMENSVAYTFELRDIYNQYGKKGFEIYQVSLDRNKLFWEDATQNIPWLCVRDKDGLNTRYAGLYNVRSIPSNFLLSKKGEIIARDLPFEELKKMIQRNL